MMLLALFLSSIFLLPTDATGQSVFSGGPITGAVTHQSARVYIRTIQPESLTIEWSRDSNFFQIDTLHATTEDGLYRAHTFELANLTPDTVYYYQLRNTHTRLLLSDRFRFRTFPIPGLKGHVRWIVGSCNYNNMPGGGQGNPNYYNELMFQAMVDFDPHFFLHLGDWGFPPAVLGADHMRFPERAAASFDIRYNDPNMKTFILPNMGVDYIYDDDYSHNGTAGWDWPSIETEINPTTGQPRPKLVDVLHPAGVRDGAIQHYFRFFPAYSQTDTSGIHHRIQAGPVDLWVLDSRSSKSSIHKPFKRNAAGFYLFEPDSGHTTLGTTQRNWLLNGLKNSEAPWQVMANSVVFHQKFRDLLNFVLLGQNINPSLIEFAAALAYMWAGYPEDSKILLDWIEEHQIKNIVMLSGDTHSSMMDDGSNSGIPELSSSGLSADDEGYLNYSLDSVFQSFGVGLQISKDFWNGGGNGIDNANFSDTYATVEVFHDQWLEMCIYDEFLQNLGCLRLNHNKEMNTPASRKTQKTDDFWIIYPNPSKTVLRIDMKSLQTKQWQITDLSGRVMLSRTFPRSVDVFEIDIQSLPVGKYQLGIQTDQGWLWKSWIRRP